MAETADSFAMLVARARQDEPAAVSELCRQYEPRVRLVARVLLGPALRPYLDSVDLVQSVHRSLLIGFREEKFAISSPENLVALALTLLRRKVSRQWRRLRRQQRSDAQQSSPDLLPQILADLTTPEADPAEVAQYREQLEQLCGLLDATDRQMLILRLDGFTFAEIAEQLAMNPVTLRVRLIRLRERLRTRGVLHDWL